MTDSVMLKLCTCGRTFNPVTGECNRKEPDEWIPSGWKPSSQPCGHCDREFYYKRSIEHIKKFEEENNIGQMEGG